MTPFLQQIAERYYAEFGENLSKVAFVFPNRRAGLFLRQALARVTTKPLFAPDIYAINDLFFRESELKQADKITLLFMLYKIYKELIDNKKAQEQTEGKKNKAPQSNDDQNKEESFDRFCYLGEMILADFNDIDKYMADAKQVFTNVRDLKELENHFDWMTNEQKEIIEKFWNVFFKEKTNKDSEKEDYKKHFAEIWEILPELYTKFKKTLRDEGIAYDGMIFRDVAESDADLHLDDYERVVFVGFNALTTTERKLFEKCQKSGKGDYYFDYQSPEISAKNNIAAQFIEENKKFKSQHELDAPQEPTDRKIELIAIPSDIGQTKQVYNILEKLQEENSENANLRTVVVLPNEQLLLPQLHAIPESIKTVNITMGYPLSLTPVAALIQHIAMAQRNKRETDVTQNNGTKTKETYFYYKHVLAILNHPLIAESCPEEVNDINKDIHKDNLYLVPKEALQRNDLLKTIFSASNDDAQSFAHYFESVIEALENLPSLNQEDTQIESEFLQNYKAALTRISNNLEKFNIKIEPETFQRLLLQLTASQTVAFRGEPVEGLQLMGTLETRALDFENVIIASFNEDMFPRKSNTPSLIPYNLRRAFNLPTHEYHDAIFAYNFYRLIYRARRVYLIYDSRSGSQTGEVSRYAAQLEYLYGLKIDKKSVSYEVDMGQSDLKIEKKDEVAEKLQKFITHKNTEAEKRISASAIDFYITCPMKFFFSQVEGLNNDNDVSESIEANTFGSIFHETMQKLYDPYKNKMVDKDAIENMIKDEIKIEKFIKEGFTEYQFKGREVELTGSNLLISNVIKGYVIKTLEHDLTRAPFKYCASEESYKINFAFDTNKEVTLKGVIDRVDETTDKNGITTTHIIDYKTGSKVGRDFIDVNDLFNAERNKSVKAIRQTFLYGILYKAKNKNKQKIQPLIYEFQNLDDNVIRQGKKGASKESKTIVDDFSVHEEEYTEKLKETLQEIFDFNKPFTCTDDRQNCEHCDFRGLCGRVD